MALEKLKDKQTNKTSIFGSEPNKYHYTPDYH